MGQTFLYLILNYLKFVKECGLKGKMNVKKADCNAPAFKIYILFSKNCKVKGNFLAVFGPFCYVVEVGFLTGVRNDLVR